MADAKVYTVKHFNSTTGRWHVEEEEKGQIWFTDVVSALNIQGSYLINGFEAEVVKLSELKGVENLPFNGSLVEVQ